VDKNTLAESLPSASANDAPSRAKSAGRLSTNRRRSSTMNGSTSARRRRMILSAFGKPALTSSWAMAKAKKPQSASGTENPSSSPSWSTRGSAFWSTSGRATIKSAEENNRALYSSCRSNRHPRAATSGSARIASRRCRGKPGRPGKPADSTAKRRSSSLSGLTSSANERCRGHRTNPSSSSADTTPPPRNTTRTLSARGTERGASL
jgi:hypothetical protein